MFAMRDGSSFGQWDDADAVRAWKGSPEFKERIGRVVRQATEFEPTELVTLVKVAGGTVEVLSPPAGIEPIHAQTWASTWSSGRGTSVEIERVDEETRVADLPAAAAAHEAPELLLGRPASPSRLLLERAEGAEVALRVDDLSTAAAPRARISSSSRSASHT